MVTYYFCLRGVRQSTGTQVRKYEYAVGSDLLKRGILSMRESGKHLNPYRKIHPSMGASERDALYGYFRFKIGKTPLAVISSGERRHWRSDDVSSWEHVSVSLFPKAKRLPTWEEMQTIKDLFWRKDETVVEFHAAESEYVNIYDCLHLWKPPYELTLPPTITLAPKVTGR